MTKNAEKTANNKTLLEDKSQIKSETDSPINRLVGDILKKAVDTQNEVYDVLTYEAPGQKKIKSLLKKGK